MLLEMTDPAPVETPQISANQYRWKTVLGASRFDIIDFVCPSCNRIILWDVRGWPFCPWCGLHVHQQPRRKADWFRFARYSGLKWKEKARSADFP
ncbi:MAG: hypothetical protein QHG98_03860 [Methanothrix sp.]|jgi:hypothetical protein|nr:hypothetical protein [Methanothrix sp.]